MERDELVELCQLVRSETFAAEKVGLEKTHHSDSNPELSVLCPCQSQFCFTQQKSLPGGRSAPRKERCLAISVQSRLCGSVDQRLVKHARTRTHSHTRTHARTHARTHTHTHTHTISVLEEWTESLPFTWKTLISVLKSAW